MDFYGLIEKNEFDTLIKEAKKTCVKDAVAKLKNFDPMNELFFKSAMPDLAPKVLVQKRVNKLRLLKEAKDLKRMLG